jgi:hypothetical protein
MGPTGLRHLFQLGFLCAAQLVLQQLQHFDHGSSCTAWLDPTHSNGEALQSRMGVPTAMPCAVLVGNNCCQLAAGSAGSVRSPFSQALFIAAAHALHTSGKELVLLLSLPLMAFAAVAGCLLWCASELVSLQAALAAAFPECSDLSSDPGRGITRFVPHLSIGQWRDKAALKQQLQVSE